MMWAQIRFIVDESGRYDDRWVRLDTTDIIAASLAAKSLCAGYFIGSGLSSTIRSIDMMSHPGPVVLEDGSLQAARNRIVSFGRVST